MNNKIKNFLFFLFFYFFFLNFSFASLLNPKGDISIQQKHIIIISFFTMLIIVLPVIFMSLYFSYKYNKKNNEIYKPNWNHSNIIEFFIWLIPIIIVFFLSIVSWNSTHKLEPSKILMHKNSYINIDVVSLNYKWFFIYPEKKIAILNKIVIPVNTPIMFRVTSNSVMNSFFIPSLGSQIYSMAGMINKLNLISNESGLYKGISANYSGVGFSDMKFKVIVTPDFKTFNEWVEYIKNYSEKLNTIKKFNKISNIDNYKNDCFSGVNKNLFDQIVNKFHN
ncbi:ubiquinol oxidase subunit II [Buchnera aphidicola]|uniref:ubiquinol oxidase subunit II n=1 Tax=Buchnera aphidicola TaxID=9 RepID=UPI0031B84F80